MRNRSMPLLLCIVVFLITYRFASGQDYVVLTKGDTLTGKVAHINSSPMDKVRITQPDKSKEAFSAVQVKGFGMNDAQYHTVRTAENYVFMKVLKAGYLSLYAFQLPNQHTWDGRYLLKRDGNGLEVPTLQFKKRMSAYLGECKAVTDSILAGTWGRKEINRIIDTFNECIQREEAKLLAPVEKSTAPKSKLAPWDDLAKAVRATSFAEQGSSLEMITEIKLKITRNERIPDFMLNGLRSNLNAYPELTEKLEKCIRELE
jgi:hypothetical protein